MAAEAGNSPVFWVVVVGYFVLVLGFGAYFARFNKSTSDFFFGGRRFKWWLITMSIVATGVGSHSFLKYSSMGFEHGFSSTMTYMNDWFFMPLFMFGWLPIIYFMRVRSIPEYFERRFNRPVRVLATISLLLYMLGYIGIGFLTMAKTLHPILEGTLGWSLMEIIWVVALVAGVYITFGGQTAVIFTDLLQGFILLFAGLALLLLGLDWFGGLGAFWAALPADFKLPLASFNDDPGFNFVGIFWQDAVAGSIGFLFINQGLIMRFLACKSVNEGRKAAAVNVLFMMPLSAIAVGCAGWIGRGMVSQGALPADTSPDDVFTLVTALVASKAGFGFFVAAVTAALMSTVDTLINAVAAVFVNDVYRLAAPRRDDKHYLKVAMMVSAGATVLGVGAAWIFTSFDSVYRAHGAFHSTLTPPLVTAILLGIFWRRFTTAGAVATFVIGGGLIVAGRVWPLTLIAPFSHGIPASESHPYSYIGALYNLVACFGAAVVVSLFTRRRTDEQTDGMTIWTLETARRAFKGGEPNDARGFALPLRWRVEPGLPEGAVQVDAEALQGMAAGAGDLAYVCDKRWWLGGLRSAHARLHAEPHALGEVVLLAPDVFEAGHFQEGRIVIVEKEL
ncbi:MAG: sodium/solute symporter [Planctomycetes bacterium]|nr:sodium/solute symporter [Planctomycetota bacterium]MBL7009544.1 sodium/solute symporter [Planctomycetota bacterium]